MHDDGEKTYASSQMKNLNLAEINALLFFIRTQTTAQRNDAFQLSCFLYVVACCCCCWSCFIHHHREMFSNCVCYSS